MALQVWLPLNGTLENKGLSNVTVTNNGATVDNNGKIGKCYKFNPDNSSSGQNYLRLNKNLSDILPTNGKSFSFACWIKITGNLYSNGCGLICVNQYNSTGVGLYIKSTKKIHIHMCYNGTEQEWTANNMMALQNNVWYHITYTYNETGRQMTVYINGINVDSTTANNVWVTRNEKILIGTGSQGGWAYTLPGFMNDVRIYDHCLSAKEVKEISKGLILHYKLDGNDIGITIPRNGGLIPDGVELYDYILSSGTLYIDTGYVPNNTSGIYLRAYCTTSGGNYLAIGCRQTSGNTRWWINYSTTLELSWNLWTGTLTSYTNTWTEVEHNYMNSRSAKVNGTSYSVNYPTLANITYPAYLFNSCSQGNLGTGFIGRISNAKITEGTTIVRNFLPCTYLGEPGMWDTVENKFYRNQGTGLFTLGNKITLKEYEYLLSVQGAYIDTEVDNTSDSLRMDLNFRPIQTTSGKYYTGNYTNNGGLYFEYISGSSGWQWAWRCAYKQVTKTPNTSLPETHSFYVENGTSIFLVNGNIIQSNTLNKDGGRIYIGGSKPSSSNTIATYWCKITNNGQLIKDFIPCSYNGTPGLWDKVEWKFYANAGSGSFTLGPEVTVQQDTPIFYDSSGYCNHGSITGTLTTNSDSPRYSYSTGFTGTQYIHLTPPTTEVKTISLWAKWNSIPSGQSVILVDYGSQIGLGLMSTGILCSTSGAGNSYTFPKSGIVADTWYHFVIVKTGTTGRDLYINGVKQTQTSNTSNWTYSVNELQLGKRSTTSDGFNGKLSDFRAYATALSEDDIKELYNTSAFVTNNGVFAEYELYEDNLSDVKKTGLLETANFYENGAESGYALDTDKTRVASNYIISEDFIEI